MNTRAGSDQYARRHGLMALNVVHTHFVDYQSKGVDPDMADCVNILEDFLYMDNMLDETKREAIHWIFIMERFNARARASRQRLALGVI